MKDARALLQDWVQSSNNIVFFGGAGVSTESGIPDFRSADGLYRQSFRYPPETMLSHTFFLRHTAEFYEFYRAKMIPHGAKPNAAHDVLARWEREGRLRAVVTQNIDGLHQMAGSKNVLELHGSIHRNHCLRCGKFYPLSAIEESEGVPRCACGGTIKPDVVLYEEPLDEATWAAAVHAIAEADVLIVGGTSLTVYPAAALLDAYCGQKLVLINRDATPRDDAASLVLRGAIGEILGGIAAAVDGNA